MTNRELIIKILQNNNLDDEAYIRIIWRNKEGTVMNDLNGPVEYITSDSRPTINVTGMIPND